MYTSFTYKSVLTFCLFLFITEIATDETYGFQARLYSEISQVNKGALPNFKMKFTLQNNKQQ